MILKNAKIAFDTKRPLCQDTGQVTVFIQMGQSVQIKGDFIEDVINKAVEDSYRDNFFRKSIRFLMVRVERFELSTPRLKVWCSSD